MEHGACYGREEMRVFVAVDVRDVDSRALELLDLRERLPCNILRANRAAQRSLGKVYR